MRVPYALRTLLKYTRMLDFTCNYLQLHPAMDLLLCVVTIEFWFPHLPILYNHDVYNSVVKIRFEILARQEKDSGN